ncbi:MAG: transcription termination factor Rho [Bacteroidaceae bacterium]|nr:transcription termination factor Rho [Bacteroidaceae bacterium]
MSQYTHEQLMLVEIDTLKSIAQELNTPNHQSNDKEILISDILQIQTSEALPTPTKRKRGRPTKTENIQIKDEEIISAINNKSNKKSCKKSTLPTSTEVEVKASDDFVADHVQDVEFELKPCRPINADFYVIEDIPEVEKILNEQDTANTQPNSKFRKFENDPLIQKRDENANNTNVPKSELENQKKSKEESVEQILANVLLNGRGVLELTKEGYGFLRSADYNYLSSPDDIYVSPVQLRQYGLKPGDIIEGKVKIPREEDKFFILHSVERINGMTPEQVRNRVAFEHLTPLFPNEKFNLTQKRQHDASCRIVDLFAPIGKGQRAMIVAQPKTGKTMLLKSIANAISENHPEAYLMMLLIDERPEEVTDMKRTVNAEVIASTFDAPAANHVKIASIVLEKAKRMVECGHDVVIFLDSITRLARAYNTEAPASGKVLSGGVDANSLQKPKRFFGAARNIEGGGSLTIIATALIDTGSKMDEVIYEEFKGTGNMELQLERQLANKRIFPAINLIASSTRRDDLLHDETTINRMWVYRNFIADMNCIEAMQNVLKQVENTKNNEELLMTMSNR